MFTDAFQDGDNGIPIRYCFVGKLFNLRRLQAKSTVQTEVLDEFLFADDMAKGASTEEKTQPDLDNINEKITILNQILIISMHTASLVKRPCYLLKLSSRNENMGVYRADNSVKI